MVGVRNIAGRCFVVFICGFVTPPAFGGMSNSDRGLPRVNLFGSTYDNNHYSSMCVACHDRSPGAHIPPVDNAAYGSHFVYGGASLVTQKQTLEKTDGWVTVGTVLGSGAVSKYGKPGSNVNAAPARTGEILCESCHNLLLNTGRKLLVMTDNNDTDPSALCEGCHQKTGAGHHPLTNEPVFVRGGTISNVSPLIWNPPVPVDGRSEVTYPVSPGVINCRSCHTPHKARTNTGARILKRGWKATMAEGDQVRGVSDGTGIQRQFDIDPGTPPTNRLVTDFTALCDACHKASN